MTAPPPGKDVSLCCYAVFPLVAFACAKCGCERTPGWVDSESLAFPPSAWQLSSQRMRGLNNVCEGLEKANIQREETELKIGIVLGLKFLRVNIPWPLSHPILTLD